MEVRNSQGTNKTTGNLSSSLSCVCVCGEGGDAAVIYFHLNFKWFRIYIHTFTLDVVFLSKALCNEFLIWKYVVVWAQLSHRSSEFPDRVTALQQTARMPSAILSSMASSSWFLITNMLWQEGGLSYLRKRENGLNLYFLHFYPFILYGPL